MGQAAAELRRDETAAGHLEVQFDPRDQEALDRLALVRLPGTPRRARVDCKPADRAFVRSRSERYGCMRGARE